MSEAQNISETKDLPYISTRRYETDNLISPSGSQQPCISPNATILSHLEINNNCKSFREIQSNQDLDGMLSHNPLQQPQDTQLSLPKDDINQNNDADYTMYGQKDPNYNPNQNKQKPRSFKERFSGLGVIVPGKRILEPIKSTNIKETEMEMNQGSGGQEHKLNNEVNNLILTDEQIIPKRSVSIIGNSDSVDSPRKVSNQSTKTQQLTPKPTGKRKLGSGRKSMALLNSPRQSPSPTRNKSGRVVPLGLNEESSIDRQGTGKQNMYVQMKKSIRFSGCGEPSVQGSNATLSQKYQQQQQQSGVLISPTNNSPNGRDDRRGYSPSISPLLKQQTSESSGVGNLLWKWGIASRVKMINRFYQRVKNQTSQLNFKFLQRFHFELIDDKSYFFDVSQISSSGKSQKAKLIPSIFIHMYWILQRNLCSMPVLSANSMLLTLWRVIYSSILVIQMFLVPFQICFDIAFNSSNEWYLLYYGPLVAYCFNILVQLNSGYYEMGQEQLDRSKVFANYKFQFLIDLLAILAFILTNTFSNPYFNICFYLKMNQLYANISDIVEHFQVHQKFSLVYTLSRLMFLILFLAHACGCVFLLISQQEFDSGNQQSWIVNSNIQYSSTFKRYLNSLYFSVITMVTVGYGDIRPIADTEKMFVIFMALLGSVVFGYVVNTIGGIFQELAQKEADFKKKKYDLSNFMTSRQIKQETQVKVMKYLDYMKMQDEDNPLRGENFLELVSKNLQEDIQKDFYGRILRQHKLFSTHFTVPFLNAISLHFKERVLGPGEMFFEQGFIGQSDIYFIQKGKVEIFCAYGTQTKSLIVNKQGEYFGQGEFFSFLPRNSSAKSITTTHVLVLPQQKFISLLKDFPQDFEIFHKLKDDFLLYKISENNKACVSCGKFNHSLIDCHYLHYKRNHDLLIARHTYSIPNQGEKSFIRGFQKTKNAFKENQDVNRDLRRYRIDIFEELLNQQYMAIDEDDRQEKLQPNVHRNSLMGVSDKKFFLMLKKLKYEEQKFVLCSDEDDLEGSLRNITEISQSEDDQENDVSEENLENEENSEEEEQGEGETSENFTEGGDIQEREEEEEEDDDTKGKNGKGQKSGKKELGGTLGELNINNSMRKGSKFVENLGQGEISTIQEVDESKKGSQTGNIFQDKLLEYIETLPKNEENGLKEGDDIQDNQSEKLSKSQLPPSSESSSSSSSDTPQSSEIKILPQFGIPKENTIKKQNESKDINSSKKLTKKISHSGNDPSSSSSSSSGSSRSSSSSSESEQSHSKKYITKTILKEKKQSSNEIKSNKQKQLHHLPQLEKKKHKNHEHSQQSNKQSTSLSQLPQDLSQSNNNSKGVASSMSQNNGTSSLSQKSISFCYKNNSPRSITSQKKLHKHSHHNHHHHKDKHNLQNILNSYHAEQKKNTNSAGDNIQIQPSQEIPLAAELSDDTLQQRNITFNNLIEITHDDQANQSEIEHQSKKNSEKPSKGFRRQKSKVLTFHRSSKVVKPPSSSRLEDIDPSGSFFRGVTSEEESAAVIKPISAVTATFIPQSPVSRQEYSSLQQEFSSLQQEFSAFQQSQQLLAQQQQQKHSQSMGLSLTHNNSKNSRKQSQSAFSEPSLFSERLKKQSFLTRDQSFKTKYSRDSRLLRACDLDDLASFKNKVPLQKMNSGSVSRFSNAFAEWNATPILKNINGIRDSSDFESSMSLGGMFSPMRSFKLKKGQILAHAFSRNSNLFTSDEEQQHINGGLGLIGMNNQNIPQNNSNNNNNNLTQKKSKFSSNNVTTTRRRSTSEDIQVGGGIQALKAKQQQQQQQQQIAQTNGQTQQQSQQSQNNKSLESISVLPNIERIKKEQERIRRNSPLLLSRNNLIAKRRQSLHGMNFNQFHSSQQNNQNSNGNQQNSAQIGQVSGSVNGVNSNNSNNLPQNALNEEHLVRRLKELLQGQEDDKAPLDGMYSQRGSRMYGVGQDYLLNPLLLDHNMFFMPDFDTMKEYELYYKNNNYSNVLKKIKGKQKNKRFLQQRVQRKKLLTIYKAQSFTKIEA